MNNAHSIIDITTGTDHSKTIDAKDLLYCSRKKSAQCYAYGVENTAVRFDVDGPPGHGVTGVNVGNVHIICDGASSRS